MSKNSRAVWGTVLTVPLILATAWSRSGRAQEGGSDHNGPTAPQATTGRPADRFVPGRILLKFRDGTSDARARGLLASYGARAASRIPGIDVHVVNLPESAIEGHLVQAFSASPDVEFAELDRVVPAEQLVPNDPLYTSAGSWALWKIKGPEAWAMTTGGSDVVIAVLDTGVDGTHEDLAGQMVPGRNIYNNNSDTADVSGHGTGVAGAAAAASNNGLGVASVAWGCRIMPVRISDNYGYASYSDIASGLTWAADHGARVANISYNVTGSSTVSSAARYFQRGGGVIASAAGNNGTFAQTADDPYILTVGATDASDLLFPWSNSGKNLDVVAPGNVSTTIRGGGYGGGGGTSFSSPLVAGAAALVMSTNPSLSPAQVQDILKKSADDLGAAGWDSTYGSGRLNLERAVSMALVGGGADTTPPSAGIMSPADGAAVSGTVNVSVSAADDVGVTKVELYVDGALYASSSTPPFTVKWNTRKATPGAHALQERAYDAAGNVGVSQAVIVYR